MRSTSSKTNKSSSYSYFYKWNRNKHSGPIVYIGETQADGSYLYYTSEDV